MGRVLLTALVMTAGGQEHLEKIVHSTGRWVGCHETMWCFVMSVTEKEKGTYNETRNQKNQRGTG